MKHQLLLLLLIISSYTFAQQGEIKGIVKDAATSETIIGASITYATGKGVVTDVNGNYSIKVNYGDYTIAISMIGYAPIIQKVKVGPEPVIVNAELKIKTLDEVEVVADVATTRETPVAFSNISTKQIQEELGTRDLPMLLNATPGAYATEQGGGAGDARINIRGCRDGGWCASERYGKWASILEQLGWAWRHNSINASTTRARCFQTCNTINRWYYKYYHQRDRPKNVGTGKAGNE